METKKKQAPQKKYPVGYEVDDLPALGWITVHYVGEENAYFTLADGSEGYVKVSAWAPEVKL